MKKTTLATLALALATMAFGAPPAKKSRTPEPSSMPAAAPAASVEKGTTESTTHKGKTKKHKEKKTTSPTK